MKGRFQYDLLIANTSAATTIADQITGMYADQDVYGDEREPTIGPLVSIDPDGVIHITGSVRFNVPGSENAVLTRLTNVWKRSQQPYGSILPGSRVGVHQCSHDDASPAPCSVNWSVK